MIDLASIGVAPLAAASVAAAGLLQSAAGVAALRQFQNRDPLPAGPMPPVTVLKPLCGDEAMLEAALASFCGQDYPCFQIVFGVQSAADPALAVVERIRARFPHREIDVVVDATRHGRNGKVGNLINMMRAARHDILVIADSDIHTPAETLRSVVGQLSQPGVGLVTALYTGLPPGRSSVGRIGAAHINRDFLPGTLLARAMGRQDCLGAIMALSRQTLERIGGFAALADHVADDALLGQLVRTLGLSVALADVVPATTVPETTLSALYTHELRWMRTVKSVAPVGFVLSSIQYPMVWALLMLALSGGDKWALIAFAGAWLLRGILAHSLDRMLRISAPLTIWFVPLRDLLSVLVMVASYGSNRVAWRGQTHHVTSFSRAVLQPGKG